jgi:hypothetical protein
MKVCKECGCYILYKCVCVVTSNTGGLGVREQGCVCVCQGAL